MACSGCEARRLWLKNLRDIAYERSKQLLGIEPSSVTVNPVTTESDGGIGAHGAGNEQSSIEQSGTGSSDH